jgi:hypothetical protein
LLGTANTFTQPQTANSFIVTSSTVPTNGVYLPAANTLGLATNSGVRMQIDPSGFISIGGGIGTSATIRIGKTITGGTSAYVINTRGVIQSDVTDTTYVFNSNPDTAAAAFTLTNLFHFNAAGLSSIGASSAVTSQYGFVVSAGMTGGTNNYGFFGALAAASNRWNAYMNGTAANYFAGQTTVGSTSLTLGATSVAQQFGVVSTAATNIAMVVRGAASQSGDLFQAQNSAGTVLAKIDSSGNLTQGRMNITDTAYVNDLRVANSLANKGSGSGVVAMANAATVPSTNPTGGGVLYVESGALKYRGSSGTITTLGAA